MQNDIRHSLSQALSPESEFYARLVADSSTQIEVYLASFLKHYAIYRVEHFNPHKPVLFYVGFAQGKSAYLLTGAPENYIRLAQVDTIIVDSPEKAVNYATVYLEVTRSMSELFYLVHSVNDVKFRPNLTSEEEKIKTSFFARYRGVITAPKALPQDQGYTVTAYRVHEQALERYSLIVSRDGDINAKVTFLEKDLPLVYGL